MSEVRIAAEPRTEFGKGGARRTRRAGKIPAVLYGHGQPPRHIALPAREFAAAIRGAGSNALLTLELADGTELALPKAIQRHPIKNEYEHVDLLLVRSGEKVTVEIRVILVGEAQRGVLVDQQLMTLSLETEATHIPESVEINLDGLEVGAHVSAGSVELPPGTTLPTDPDQVVVAIFASPTAEQLDATMPAEAAAAEVPVEPAAAATPV